MNKKLIVLFLLTLITYQLKAQVEPLLFYKAQQDSACREWVESIMSKMTLKEKVGQLIIYTIAPQNNNSNLNLLHEVVKTHKVGGLLFSGGDMLEQAKLINYAQNNASVPLMITFDGEWGLAMRLKNTPSFPRNMVLGCIEDDRLIYEYGKEVARELKELGVHVNFAPVADININPKNPVINTRSFGEDPVNVTDKVVAYSSGLESGGILSVAKHFPGHGDTDVDSHHALPLLPFSRQRMDSVELLPFKQIVRSGLGGIMTGHLQVPAIDENNMPASLSYNIITNLLKNELNFKGLIFTDALEMKGVAKYENRSAKALAAGNDMVLTPRRIKAEIDGVMEELGKGVLTEEMINQKCRKVLMHKYVLGLSKKPYTDVTGLSNRINKPYADSLINQLKIAAITVLGNEQKTLPMHPKSGEVAVVTLGKRLHGESPVVKELDKLSKVVHFHLPENVSTANLNKLKLNLSGYKYIIVGVSTSSVLDKYDTFLSGLSTEAQVVYAYFAPLSSMEKLPKALSSGAATVLAHSHETVIQRQVVNILFGRATANGRLSASVPGIFDAGSGVTITPDTPHYYTPEELGVNPAVLAKIDTIAKQGIKEKAYPGCQIYILKGGNVLYDKSFGTFTYDKGSHQVETTDLYDLASLTKTTGTLLAVMKLYDKGLLNITDKISQHLAYLKNTDKTSLTVKELLFHQSGLPSSIFFYREAIDENSYKKPFVIGKPDKAHSKQIGRKAYIPSSFKFKEGLISTSPSEIYSIQVADNFWLNRSFSEEEKRLIMEAPVRTKKYLYSCVNFVLLKEIVEEISGKTLDVFLDEEFYKPMGLHTIAYVPLRYFPKERIAPTVKNDYLRKHATLLQGFVHDETAAFFGGVSGNAGLFASAADVAAIHQLWLDKGMYKGKRYLSEETCRLFTTSTSGISRRGLGFDRHDKNEPDNSPCTKLSPGSVYGHTGFTGTCAWVDPDNELVYVFLSNRTYPDGWNSKLMSLKIRPRIQEVLYQSINKKIS